VKSAWVFDARAARSSTVLVSPPPEIDFSDRDYFKAHVAGDIGTYHRRSAAAAAALSGRAVLRGQPPAPQTTASFTGVIQASVLSRIFREFLRRIGREPGSFFALGRAMARCWRFLPLDRDIPPRADGPAGQLIAANPQGGLITGDVAGRRNRTPCRHISGSPNIRSMSAPARDLGDTGALALHHRPASDLRRAATALLFSFWRWPCGGRAICISRRKARRRPRKR
jgi:hypothetical protein